MLDAAAPARERPKPAPAAIPPRRTAKTLWTTPPAPSNLSPPGPPTPTAPPSTAAAASYTPGATRYRVVNAGAAAVDVHVRTQGLVTAYLVTEGVAPGAATDYVAPPDPGTLVVTTAGSGNATCVGTCPHILGTWSTTAGQGDQHTIVLSADGATDLWEHPKAADIGAFANAIPPADPEVVTLHVVGEPLTGADFGLRLAYQGVAGCQVSQAGADMLIGGTTVVPFTYPEGTINVMLHDNRDRDCSAAPVGGPFWLTADPGSRAYLILSGSPGAMAGLVLAIP
jgi:hypothetical protein